MRFRRIFEAHGIETLIHYPVPIPHQPALAAEHPAECPVAVARHVRRSSRCRSIRRCRGRRRSRRRRSHGRGNRGGRGWRSAVAMLAVILQILQLAVVAWLPGAALFRLPSLDRERRAALDAEERAFWAVMLSLAISLSIVLALGSAPRYTFDRLLLADRVSPPRLWPQRVDVSAFGSRTARRMSRTVLVPALLIVLAAMADSFPRPNTSSAARIRAST